MDSEHQCHRVTGGVSEIVKCYATLNLGSQNGKQRTWGVMLVTGTQILLSSHSHDTVYVSFSCGHSEMNC